MQSKRAVFLKRKPRDEGRWINSFESLGDWLPPMMLSAIQRGIFVMTIMHKYPVMFPVNF
jgi:hypothetical protein